MISGGRKLPPKPLTEYRLLMTWDMIASVAAIMLLLFMFVRVIHV
jgi:hypothetical protein